MQVVLNNAYSNMIKEQNEIIKENVFCKVHHFLVPFCSIFLDLNTVCSKCRISQHPLNQIHADSHKPPFDPFKLFSRTIAQ